MSERFIMDTCGTLIDKETRDTYDYVSEVCPLLNKQEERIRELEDAIKTYDTGCKEIYGDKCKLEEENQRLKGLLNEQETIICNLNKSLTNSLPVWVVKKVINRRIKATNDDTVKKELKELLNELL